MPLGAFKAALMGTAGVSTGPSAPYVVLLHDTDYSDVASVSITSGITSTYKEYIFKFYNINVADYGSSFGFNGSIDSGSNYNVAKTTTHITVYHTEPDSAASLGYNTSNDLAQGTGFQPLGHSLDNDADHSSNGELHLFNPSSTTYVKHFYSVSQGVQGDDASQQALVGGYFNTTSAIDAIQFKPSAGNFDGTIKMWGVK